NELDRKNRNNHNDNYKELYRLKQVIKDLVLDSGESDAEVVQAREGEETLNDRLDIMEDKTENVSKNMEELEEDLTKETEDRLQATLDEVEDTVQDIIEANEFKGAMVVMAKNKNVKHENGLCANGIKLFIICLDFGAVTTIRGLLFRKVLKK